jgi:hypothetical protein
VRRRMAAAALEEAGLYDTFPSGKGPIGPSRESASSGKK